MRAGTQSRDSPFYVCSGVCSVVGACFRLFLWRAACVELCKDAGLLANGQTVKNCEIHEHRYFAFYTLSPSGWTILRIYMATARLRCMLKL